MGWQNYISKRAEAHNPLPGSGPIPLVPLDGAVSSGLSLGTQALRDLVHGNNPLRQASRFIRPPSPKRQRKKMKRMVTENTNRPGESTTDEGIQIFIVDLDATNANGDFGKDQIQLQTVPRQLVYDPETNWNAITPMARNTPFYHYTGGADTLTMTLDWYSNKTPQGGADTQRHYALTRAKWLEAKCRNDGLEEPPHRVKLIWGEDTERFYPMFNESTWIVSEAPYTMSMFHKQHALRPTQIIQQLVLKRVSAFNTSTARIKGYQF